MDVREIQKEISKLERLDTTYSNCEKLSVLYTVLDGLQKKASYENSYSAASLPPALGTTEFGVTFEQAPYDLALGVLEEHMEAIKIAYPKEYSLILKKLTEY